MLSYFLQTYNSLKKDKSFLIFSCIVIAFFGLMIVVESLNGQFQSNDFRVFYTAANNYWNNEPVYGLNFGLDTGYYKYSPVVLLFFLPSILFSFGIASTIHFGITVFVLLLLFYTLFQFIEAYFPKLKKRNLFVLLFLLISVIGHLVRELHLGNTNVILLLLVFLSLKIALKNQNIRSGFLFAIVVLTKPYLIVLALPILLMRKYKVFWSCLIWTVLLVVFSFFIFGMNTGIFLYLDWYDSIMAHSEYLVSNNTLINILNTFFKIQISNGVGILTYLVFCLALFLFFKFKYSKLNDLSQTATLFFFTLISMFPFFLVTDTEHFLFSIPMIAFLILHIYERKKVLSWIVLGLLIVFYLGETQLLFGKTIHSVITLYGGVGLANIILVAWSFVVMNERIIRHTEVYFDAEK